MREIEAFLAVAEELHFGRAAARLRLSTSRVSTLVRTVERRTGVSLFERTSRVVRLTPPGRQLFTELRAAYVRIERGLADVRHTASLSGGGVLRVGFSTTLPAKLSAELVRTFERRHPDCRVVVSELPTADLFRWIGKEWPVDVFVTWMPTDAAPIEPPLQIGPPIHAASRAVILPADHLLAGRSTVDIEDLAGYDVIHLEVPAWYGEQWTPATTPGGRRMKLRRMSAMYVEDVFRLVAQGGLAHLTITPLLSTYERPGVVVAPLTGLPPIPVRAVWPDSLQEPMAHSFAEVSGSHAA